MSLAKPSSYQQAFIDAACQEKNVTVIASAGSGKTTASLNLLWQYIEKYPTKRTMYVAFQNEVTKDIKRKIKANIPASVADQIDVRTSYSLGYELLRDHHTTELNDGKTSAILGWKLGELYKPYGGRNSLRAITLYGEFSELKRMLLQIYNVAQTRLFFDLRGIAAIEQEQQIMPFPPTEDVLQVVLDTIKESRKWLESGGWGEEKKKTHDFTDMVSYPAYKGYESRTKYDLILVDETQDIGEAQLRVIEAYADSNTQWVFVGDPAQNIMVFAGAIPSRMALLKEKYACEEYSMPISYRASIAVRNLAKQYVPSFECRNDAPVGFVGNVGLSNAVAKMNVGDYVLARTIAQLLEVAILALTTGKKVSFLGGNLKQQVKAALDDIKNRFTFNDFPYAVEQWVSAGVELLRDKHGENADERIDEMQRLGKGLLGLYTHACKSNCDSFEKWVDEIFVGETGKKREPSIVFLTGHRGKGLEADTVFIVQPPNGNLPYTNSKMSPMMQQVERNLYYVMLTRSKHTLWHIVPDSTPNTYSAETPSENAPQTQPEVLAEMSEEEKFITSIAWDNMAKLKVDYADMVRKYRMLDSGSKQKALDELHLSMRDVCVEREGVEKWFSVVNALGLLKQRELI